MLYKDFSLVKSPSFFNSLKFIGDNPYKIEQSIKEDFELYSKQLEQIKSLLDINKSEFISLRNEEFRNQLSAIYKGIDAVVAKEDELKELISRSKKEFINLRNGELKQQIESITEIISLIDTVFFDNKDNPDITNHVKIKSFGFKILSVLSKNRKKTIADYTMLQINFSKLRECIKASKDFQNPDLICDLAVQRSSVESVKKEISTLKSVFSIRIEKEFDQFNLTSILNDGIRIFEPLQSAIKNPLNSEEFKANLRSIQSDLTAFLSDVNLQFETLEKDLIWNKDFKLHYFLNNTFEANKAVLNEIREKIESIKNGFDSKIQNEFQQLSLLKLSPAEIEIKTLPAFQEQVKVLTDKIEKDCWTTEKIDCSDFYKFLSDVELNIYKRNEYFEIDNESFLFEFKWFQFYNQLSENNKTILNALKSKSNWRKSLLIYYLDSTLINSANIDLPTGDTEHKELDTVLNGVEKEQLKFIKEFWFSKQIDTTREFEQKNVALSVENLYNKRSSNRFKRLSLRQIVQYDADLFTNFFPIILTSPDVASNLFKGMNGYFDIVMFDEASQLRLEDNLPAILKGKQIIIAGDEHQMPPSNYFSKVFDGAVEDEEDLEEESAIVVDKDNILLSCESLLDFGSELNFQRKHLDFHYRSRHPFLIDFSNYAFYNQRLKPLPNNFNYVPIKYVQVNGTFSEHTNEAEAEMVLSIIDKNINRLPDGQYPTVGIATFNIAQRNLIKSKILERQKFSKFAGFNSKIQELEEKGMFIKNLENIQGDERDVIILSTTYGIGKDRKFAQRFGPINHSKGYKLLNVIITRAKFKVYCCTSIPEQVFMNYKEYLTVEGSNNKRAVLYAYLAYCKAVSESNNDLRLSVLTTLAENTTKSAGFDSFKGGDLESPFEEEVYQSLADHLGTEKLIPQLQFAGFRIDIVYDPKVIGVPKIAIECDGAKYHSSREAYLYDRHRQKILEDHGFIFHRIWSTNWWRNSSRETTKLVDFIKKTEASKISNYKDHSNTTFAFTDDIEILEDYVSQTSFIDVEKDVEIIQFMEKAGSDQTENITNEVKLNSKVHVKYVNTGKDINVHIVPTEKNKNDVNDEVQKIYYKSALAYSLIGRTVGDIVKVGNLDNFVEIIKIKN